MRGLLARHSVFFVPYILFLALSSILLLGYAKEDIHVYINRFHTPYADIFFAKYTHLADGIVVFFIATLLFIFNRIKSIYIISALLLGTLITQSLKHLIYHMHMRPSVVLEHIPDLYLVPGVQVHAFNSFPSGHSTAAFCLASAILFAYNVKGWGAFFLFIYAFLSAYARIYLSQHFLVDVFAGSLIGVLSAIAMHPLILSNKRLRRISFFRQQK